MTYTDKELATAAEDNIIELITDVFSRYDYNEASRAYPDDRIEVYDPIYLNGETDYGYKATVWFDLSCGICHIDCEILDEDEHPTGIKINAERVKNATAEVFNELAQTRIPEPDCDIKWFEIYG